MQSKAQLWVELLEAQLADSTSDLSLALHFNSTPPEERAWQFICFRNGSRAFFEFCVRSFFIQDEEVASFFEGRGGKLFWSNFQPQVRFQLEAETPSWQCSLFHFSSGCTNFPLLKARFNTLLNYFDLKRDFRKVRRRRPLTDFQPALWEMRAPLKFSVQLEPLVVSAHEKLENMWTLRERLALESSPEKDSLLQAVLPSR